MLKDFAIFTKYSIMSECIDIEDDNLKINEITGLTQKLYNPKEKRYTVI